MNRIFEYTVLAVLALSLLGSAQPVYAQLTAGAQLGYGSASYGQVLGGELEDIKEWSGRFSAAYVYEDLFFTGLYQYAHALQETNITRNLGLVGANYLFFRPRNIAGVRRIRLSVPLQPFQPPPRRGRRRAHRFERAWFCGPGGCPDRN